jgi:hypothetical protein
MAERKAFLSRVRLGARMIKRMFLAKDQKRWKNDVLFLSDIKLSFYKTTGVRAKRIDTKAFVSRNSLYR